MLGLTFQVASLSQLLSLKNRRFIISTSTGEKNYSTILNIQNRYAKPGLVQPTDLSNGVNYFYHHFGPYLYQTKLPQYIIDRLLVDGKKCKQNVGHELAGHIDNQFSYEDETMDWFTDEMQPVISSYRQGHCEYHGVAHDPITWDLQTLWVNFMKAGDYNPIHTHDNDYSFVIFLQVPEELDKEADEFKGTDIKPATLYFQFAMSSRPKWATTDTRIRPRVGDMYIFPSSLEHTVIPFKSDVTRISVSGNINIDKSQFSNNTF
jgi:uncharacterized protein (TIGR02466 family)